MNENEPMSVKKILGKKNLLKRYKVHGWGLLALQEALCTEVKRIPSYRGVLEQLQASFTALLAVASGELVRESEVIKEWHSWYERYAKNIYAGKCNPLTFAEFDKRIEAMK